MVLHLMYFLLQIFKFLATQLLAIMTLHNLVLYLYLLTTPLMHLLKLSCLQRLLNLYLLHLYYLRRLLNNTLPPLLLSVKMCILWWQDPKLRFFGLKFFLLNTLRLSLLLFERN